LINLGFITEGRLVDVLIIPSSWGSQQGVIYTPSMISTMLTTLISSSVIALGRGFSQIKIARNWVIVALTPNEGMGWCSRSNQTGALVMVIHAVSGRGV
jgi:hypothetical protein